MDAPISFFVAGQPRPAGSKRPFVPKNWKGAIVVDANPQAKDWKGDVKYFAQKAMRENGATRPPLTGALSAKFVFHMPRPKSHFKSNGQLKANAPLFHAVRPDALKLARGTEDALTGVVYKDDSLIAIEHMEKIYSAEPGCLIEIAQIPIVEA